MQRTVRKWLLPVFLIICQSCVIHGFYRYGELRTRERPKFQYQYSSYNYPAKRLSEPLRYFNNNNHRRNLPPLMPTRYRSINRMISLRMSTGNDMFPSAAKTQWPISPRRRRRPINVVYLVPSTRRMNYPPTFNRYPPWPQRQFSLFPPTHLRPQKTVWLLLTRHPQRHPSSLYPYPRTPFNFNRFPHVARPYLPTENPFAERINPHSPERISPLPTIPTTSSPPLQEKPTKKSNTTEKPITTEKPTTTNKSTTSSTTTPTTSSPVVSTTEDLMLQEMNAETTPLVNPSDVYEDYDMITEQYEYYDETTTESMEPLPSNSKSENKSPTKRKVDAFDSINMDEIEPARNKNNKKEMSKGRTHASTTSTTAAPSTAGNVDDKTEAETTVITTPTTTTSVASTTSTTPIPTTTTSTTPIPTTTTPTITSPTTTTSTTTSTTPIPTTTTTSTTPIPITTTSTTSIPITTASTTTATTSKTESTTTLSTTSSTTVATTRTTAAPVTRPIKNVRLRKTTTTNIPTTTSTEMNSHIVTVDDPKPSSYNESVMETNPLNERDQKFPDLKSSKMQLAPSTDVPSVITTTDDIFDTTDDLKMADGVPSSTTGSFPDENESSDDTDVEITSEDSLVTEVSEVDHWSDNPSSINMVGENDDDNPQRFGRSEEESVSKNAKLVKPKKSNARSAPRRRSSPTHEGLKDWKMTNNRKNKVSKNLKNESKDLLTPPKNGNSKKEFSDENDDIDRDTEEYDDDSSSPADDDDYYDDNTESPDVESDLFQTEPDEFSKRSDDYYTDDMVKDSTEPIADYMDDIDYPDKSSTPSN